MLSWNADVDVSIIPEMGAHEPAWWYALPDVRMTKLLCSGTWRPQRSDLAMCVAKAVLDVSSPIRLDRMRSVECLLSSMIYESSLSKYLPPACAYAVLRRAVDCACSEDVIKALVLRCLPTYSKELSAMITQLVDGQKESGNFKDYILKILIESGVPVDNPSKLFGDLVRRYQFEEQLPEQLDLLSFFLSHVSVDSSVIYSDLHNPCVQRHTALVELLSKHSKPDDRTKLLYFIECNKPEEFKQYVAEHVVDFNFIPESHKKAPEGVDPAHWKGHSTLLGVAVKYLRLELVEYLVSQGADTMVPVQINGQYMQPLDFVLTRTDWPFITEFDKKITILLIDHGTKASEVTLKHRDIRVVLYALASNLDLIEKIDQRKVAVLLQEMPKDFKYQKVRLALVRRLPCKERLQYARVCCSVYRDYEPLKQLVMEWEPADGLGWYDLHSVIELVKDGQLQLAEALFARGLVSNTREGGRYIQSALERGDTDLAQLLKKYCMVDNPGLDQAGEGRK